MRILLKKITSVTVLKFKTLGLSEKTSKDNGRSFGNL